MFYIAPQNLYFLLNYENLYSNLCYTASLFFTYIVKLLRILYNILLYQYTIIFTILFSYDNKFLFLYIIDKSYLHFVIN